MICSVHSVVLGGHIPSTVQQFMMPKKYVRSVAKTAGKYSLAIKHCFEVFLYQRNSSQKWNWILGVYCLEKKPGQQNLFFAGKLQSMSHFLVHIEFSRDFLCVEPVEPVFSLDSYV